MIRQQTISTSYTIYDAPALLQLGRNVVTGLTNNLNYPEPPQKLSDLTLLLDELSSAIQDMDTGLKAATQRRNYLRPQCEAMLRALSAYCVSTTPKRPDLWAAANFPLTKADTSPRAFSQPITGLRLEDGPSTQTLLAFVDLQPGMYAYIWRIYPKDTPPEALAAGYCYRVCISRQPQLLIDGLSSGTAYAIECAAWNNTGSPQWSAPVFRIVQ